MANTVSVHDLIFFIQQFPSLFGSKALQEHSKNGKAVMCVEQSAASNAQ